MLNSTINNETTLTPAMTNKSRMTKRILKIVGIGVAGLVLLFAISVFMAMFVWNGLDAGQTAPVFSGQDLNGNTISLTDYAGKPVMLTFWSPECSACREELPALQAIATDPNADVTLVTVVSKMSAAKVQEFVAAEGLTFPVIVDEAGGIATDYEIVGVPVSYFINPDGTIDQSVIGAGPQGALKSDLFAWLSTCDLDEVCK